MQAHALIRIFSIFSGNLQEMPTVQRWRTCLITSSNSPTTSSNPGSGLGCKSGAFHNWGGKGWGQDGVRMGVRGASRRTRHITGGHGRHLSIYGALQDIGCPITERKEGGSARQRERERESWGESESEGAGEKESERKRQLCGESHHGHRRAGHGYHISSSPSSLTELSFID